MSVNKVILIGNLGKDPEVRYLQGGNAVCTFSLATSDNYTDKQGGKQQRTEWHNIVVWARQAESCAQYLGKGSKAYIEGRIQNRSYDDKNGVKRYITEIVAQRVQFLTTRKPVESETQPGPTDSDEGYPAIDPDDDIPF